MPRFLRYLYGKLGPKYPGTVLGAQFLVAHIVVLGGLGLLALYRPMSLELFMRLLVFTEALVVVDNAVSLRLTLRMLRPVRSWLDGQRDARSAVAAWRALVDLPGGFLRRRWLSPLFITLLPVVVFICLELNLKAYSGIALFLGGMVVLGYGVFLRFFAMELILRPVLEDVAIELPDGVVLPRAGVPLRWKLLIGLPVINIVTGVVVAGLVDHGHAKLRDLGISVLVSIAIAFTTSFELTLLLARSILQPLQRLRDATLRVARGDLDVRVPVMSTDETGVLAQSFNTAVAGLAERERLREAFGSYVDPEIAEKVLREGEILGGEEVEVSILFLDIRDFTSFAERSSAREVVERLNRFWECVVPVILRHGGHANKFIGDGLLAVFGAPDRREDHAERAVLCAIDLARIVHEEFTAEIQIGIGVNSGPVVAGTIGGGGRLEFTVIGDAVNTAARVEAATRQTGDIVLVTEQSRCLLTKDCGGFEERGAIPLKGKREPVRVHAPATLDDLAVAPRLDADAAEAAEPLLRETSPRTA